jgi:YD repeat-containing protein
VRYGYDERNRLVSVVYPSGQVFHYEYDSAQHMLTFSVAANAAATPRVLLRNEYENGLLTKQTLAEIGTYTYTNDSANLNDIRKAIVDSPNGKIFTIDIGYGYSRVRSRPEQISERRGQDLHQCLPNSAPVAGRNC